MFLFLTDFYNMKNTTNNIKVSIQNDILNSVVNLRENHLNTFWMWLILPWSDTSIEDFKVIFKEIKDFLLNNKNENIIDFLPNIKRRNIEAHLNNAISHATTINNWGNAIEQLYSSIDSLYDYLYFDITYRRNKDNLNIELAGLRKEKSEYKSLSKTIINIVENRDTIDKFIGIKAVVEEIGNIKNTASELFKPIEEYNVNIESQKNTIADVISKYIESESDYNILHDKSESLLKKITTLLEHAVSWKWSTVMKEKSDWINLNFRINWLFLCTVVSVFLLLRWFWLLKRLWLGWWNLEGITSTWLTIARLWFLTPFIAMDIFLYRQYVYYRDLKEKYSFKSIISWTMDSYITLLNEHYENEDQKKYIIDVTRDIFKSPIDEWNNTIWWVKIEKILESILKTFTSKLTDFSEK